VTAAGIIANGNSTYRHQSAGV